MRAHDPESSSLRITQALFVPRVLGHVGHDFALYTFVFRGSESFALLSKKMVEIG